MRVTRLVGSVSGHVSMAAGMVRTVEAGERGGRDDAGATLASSTPLPFLVLRRSNSPLSNQLHNSLCELVCNPPRYLYTKTGLPSSSSRRYRSALLLLLLECVESERPVS